MGETLCPICGNTGFDINDNPCTCKLGQQPLDMSVTCLTIPEQYRGVMFDRTLVPRQENGYPLFLEQTLREIDSQKMRHRNLFIYSKARSSKSVMAYSCIQNLFRKNIPTFPLMDIGEIKSVMNSLDVGKTSLILEEFEVEPINLYKAPYVFVKMNEQSYSAIDALMTLLDRRTRRDNCTIVISNIPWSFLVQNDKSERLSDIAGDGSYGSMEIKSYYFK